MNFKVLGLVALASLSFSIFSEPIVYGKLLLTFEFQDREAGRESNLVSNASRVGVKGNINFTSSLKGIYQIEYEVDPVHGKADKSRGRFFEQRDSFIGLKGSYGTLFLGKHNTAFKESQEKIDLFNNLAADIKNLLQGENRMTDFVGYVTPTFGSGFSGTFNAVRSSEDFKGNNFGDHLSYSLNYKTKKFYASIAIDSKIKGYDSTRYSFKIPIDVHQLGLIYQESKKIRSGIKEGGFVVSFQSKVGEKGTLKTQVSESDMKLVSGKQVTFGYDHKLSEELKVFFFHTNLSTQVISKDKTILSIGFEYNF
mgnify:FL=1